MKTTLTFGCIRADWYLCLQDRNGETLLRCRTYRNDNTADQVQRIRSEAMRLGHMQTLLDSEVYPGAGGPKLILEGLRDRNET